MQPTGRDSEAGFPQPPTGNLSEGRAKPLQKATRFRIEIDEESRLVVSTLTGREVFSDPAVHRQRLGWCASWWFTSVLSSLAAPKFPRGETGQKSHFNFVNRRRESSAQIAATMFR